MTRASSSPLGPIGSASATLAMTRRPVSSSTLAIKASAVPKRVSVVRQISETMGITVS